jgi:hypothetical protein
MLLRVVEFRAPDLAAILAPVLHAKGFDSAPLIARRMAVLFGMAAGLLAENTQYARCGLLLMPVFDLVGNLSSLVLSLRVAISAVHRAATLKGPVRLLPQVLNRAFGSRCLQYPLPSVAEDALIARALCERILPALAGDDASRIRDLICLTFPGTVDAVVAEPRPASHWTETLQMRRQQNSTTHACWKGCVTRSASWVCKRNRARKPRAVASTLIFAYANETLFCETLGLMFVCQAKRGVIVVGEADSGKTVVISTLSRTLTALAAAGVPGFVPIESLLINPTAMSFTELLGGELVAGRGWHEGLLPDVLTTLTTRLASAYVSWRHVSTILC